MTQYGLRTPEGTWLPRDGYKRGTLRERLPAPDLWQDRKRAEEYSRLYGAELVEFNIPTYTDRNGLLQPGHGKGEV
jgi:hypothetical protein